MNVVIGLGNIGGAIAARLVARGLRVTGVDVDPGQRAAWEARSGAPAVAGLRELRGEPVERFHVVVRTTEGAWSVLREIQAATTSPAVCHVVTTLAPAAARRFGQEPTAPLRILEQPVSGGARGAEVGTLTVLCAGPAEPSDETFLLDTLASRVVSFPEYGQPSLAKLVNNAIAAYNTRALAVMLDAAGRLGLDVAQVESVVSTSSGASAMSELLRPLAPEQADLLMKDAALLAEVVGRLPVIDLDDRAGFLADVRAAQQALDGAAGGPR
jgi:3-hydroxyisobutyrate dehydrogenase